MPRSAAGPGKEDRVRCQLGSAGPYLLALDVPPAVHLGGGGTQRGQVRARLRLGEQLAPDLLAGEDRPEVALLLGGRAELDDRGAGEVLADDVEPLGGTRPVEFLVEHRTQLGVRTAPAVLLRPGQPGIPRVVQQPLPGAPIVELVFEACGLGSTQTRQRVLQPHPSLGGELRLGGPVFELHQVVLATSLACAASCLRSRSMSLRNSCLRTLPVAVIGRESMTTTRSGVFWIGMPRSSRNSRMSSTVGASWPVAATT